MNKLPKVSVVLTTYNRSEYLNEAIESILNQTYKNIEFIIIVEYSNNQDTIIKNINKYNDTRIKIIINEKKLGLALSLNEGIKKASGKYIARMDDDDVSLPDRIEKQVKYLEDHPDTAILGCNVQNFGNLNNIDKKPSSYEEIKVNMLFETPLFHPTVIFRRDSLLKEKLLYTSEYSTEDFDLWARAINKVKIENLNDVLLKYRISNSNLTLNNQELNWNSHNTILKNLYKEIFNISFSLKEIELLRRSFNGWIIHPQDYFHYLKVKKELIEKNKIIKYCDEKLLKKSLKYHTNLIKKIIEKTRLKK